jgi:hypothetical protein
VNLAALHHRRHFVEDGGEHADEPGFGLPAQAEKDEMVARENGVDHLGYDGIVESQNAWEQRFSTLDAANQIVSEFVLDGPIGEARFGEGTVSKRT